MSGLYFTPLLCVIAWRPPGSPPATGLCCRYSAETAQPPPLVKEHIVFNQLSQEQMLGIGATCVNERNSLALRARVMYKASIKGPEVMSDGYRGVVP